MLYLVCAVLSRHLKLLPMLAIFLIRTCFLQNVVCSHEELMRKLRAEQEAELAQEDSTNESLSAKLAILQKVRVPLPSFILFILFVCLFVCLFVRLFVRLFVCFSVLISSWKSWGCAAPCKSGGGIGRLP